MNPLTQKRRVDARIAAGDEAARRHRARHVGKEDRSRPLDLSAGPSRDARFAYAYSRLAEADARRSAELDPRKLLTPDPDERP